MVTTLTLIGGSSYYVPDSVGMINMKINGACKGVGSNAMYKVYTDTGLTTPIWVNLELVLTVTQTTVSGG